GAPVAPARPRAGSPDAGAPPRPRTRGTPHTGSGARRQRRRPCRGPRRRGGPRSRIGFVCTSCRGSRLRRRRSSTSIVAVGMDELTRLWLAAREGDGDVFASAVRRSQADVYRLVAHLVGVGGAEDVTQDTVVRAGRALPRFRGESSARTWLLAIARRACADSVRGSARRCRVAARIRPRSGADRGCTSDTTGAHGLHALVDGLEPDQRAAFVL